MEFILETEFIFVEMYVKKQTLIFVAGAIWFVVGVALLAKGLGLILFASQLAGGGKAPLIQAWVYL